MWVTTSAPPADRRLAVHDHVVALDLDLDAVGAQHGGGRFQAVAFLDAQLLQARACALPLPRKTAATASTGYSSIIAGARAAGTSTPLSADVTTRRSATSSPPSSRVASVSILRAHFTQRRIEPGAQRIGHHRFQHEVGARHDQRRNKRKRRRGRIGRHHHMGRLELGLALQGDAAAVLAMRPADDLGAEVLQHALGVVAAGFRLDHRGLARRRQARQQHRRLQLRRRHRRFVDDRDRDRARRQA